MAIIFLSTTIKTFGRFRFYKKSINEIVNIKWTSSDHHKYYVLHRLNMPVNETVDGDKFWIKNNKWHRLDGPAHDWANGTKGWYVEGKEYTEEEFNKYASNLK